MENQFPRFTFEKEDRKLMSSSKLELFNFFRNIHNLLSLCLHF